MKIIDGIPVWGEADQGALTQIKVCARTADKVALMADHHRGYAVPIGGVVAYRDSVSPSDVGYDIACIAEGSLTTLSDGRRVPIQETSGHTLIGANFGTLIDVGTPIGRKISDRDTVWIYLSSGDRLRLTLDHELLTPTGWKQVSDIPTQSHVAVSFFCGVSSSDDADPSDSMGKLLATLHGKWRFVNDPELLLQAIQELQVQYSEHAGGRK